MIPNGWLWNEAEIGEDRSTHETVASLIVITPDRSMKLIGTAFLITGEKSHAYAITAAHCLDFINRELNPNPIHHGTALPEFLPQPKEADLKQAKAIIERNGVPYACAIEIAYWDRQTDLAFLRLQAPPAFPTLFEQFYMLTNQIPQVGEQVAMIGFGEMKILGFEPEGGITRMQQRLVVRIGTVEAVHPHGNHMLKSHCIETTIPIYSGMSGGLVAKFEPGSSIMPFGVISNAPEPQPPWDARAQSGHSIAATIISEITPIADKIQRLKMPIALAGIGRTRTD